MPKFCLEKFLSTCLSHQLFITLPLEKQRLSRAASTAWLSLLLWCVKSHLFGFYNVIAMCCMKWNIGAQFTVNKKKKDGVEASLCYAAIAKSLSEKGLAFTLWPKPPPPMPCLSRWSFFEQGGGIAKLALGPSLTWGQVRVAGGSLLEAAGLGHCLGAVWDTATGGARAALMIILKEKQTWMPVRTGNEVNTAVSKSSA